ncbi:hypothetical protein FQR65_LT05883 [Abscondita terminalis]|nr:hypothetical protein FQR65_LT05883 [Abscondita terminalis]
MTIFPDKILKQHVNSFLPDSETLQYAFLRINKNNVPYQIRTFLNSFNVKYNKVLSFKLQQATTGKERIFPLTDQLWVDFNISTKSLTIPCKASSFLFRKGWDNDKETVKISFNDIRAVELVKNSTHGYSIFFRLNGPCVIFSSESEKREYLKLMLYDSYETDRLEKEVLPSLFKNKIQKVTPEEEILENSVSEGTPRPRRFGIGKYRPLDVTRSRVSYDSGLLSESYTKASTSNKSTNIISKTEDRRSNNNKNDLMEEADIFREEKENLQNNKKLKYSRHEFINATFDSSLNNDRKSDNSYYEFENSKNNAARVPQKTTFKIPNKLQMYLQQIEKCNKTSADSRYNKKTIKKNKFSQNQNSDDVIEISDDEEDIASSKKNSIDIHRNRKINQRKVGLTENGVKESMTQKNVFLSHVSAFGLKKSPSSIFSDDSNDEILTLQSEIVNSDIEFIVNGSEKGDGIHTMRGFPRFVKNKFTSKFLIKSDGRSKEKLDFQPQIDNSGIDVSTQNKDGLPRLVEAPTLKGISALGLIKSQNSEFSDESADEIFDLHPEIDNSDVELVADGLEKNEINQNKDRVRVENENASSKVHYIFAYGLRKSRNSEFSIDSAEEFSGLPTEIDNSDVELVTDGLEKNESNRSKDRVRVENEYASTKLRHISASGLRKSENCEFSDDSVEEVLGLHSEIDNSDVELIPDDLERNEISQNKNIVRAENECASSKVRHISAFGFSKFQDSADEILEVSSEIDNSDVELVAGGLEKYEGDQRIDGLLKDFTCSVTEEMQKECKISEISNKATVDMTKRDNYEIGLRQSQSSDGLGTDKNHCTKYGSPIVAGNGFIFNKLTTEAEELIHLSVKQMQSDSGNSSNEIIVDGYLGDTYVCKEQGSKDLSNDVYNEIGEACHNSISKKNDQLDNDLAMKSIGKVNKSAKNQYQAEKIKSPEILESAVEYVIENTTNLNKTTRSDSQTGKIKSPNTLESSVKSDELYETVRTKSSESEQIKSPSILKSAVNDSNETASFQDTTSNSVNIKKRRVQENTTKLNETTRNEYQSDSPIILEYASKSATKKIIKVNEIARTESPQSEIISSPNIFDSPVKSVTKNRLDLNKTVRNESHRTKKIKSPNMLEAAVKSVTENTAKLNKTATSGSQTEKIKSQDIVQSAVKSVTENTAKLNQTVTTKSSHSEKIKSPNILESAVTSITGNTTKVRRVSRTEKIKSPVILESAMESVTQNTDKLSERVRWKYSQSEKIKSPNILNSAVKHIPERANFQESKKRKLDACEENVVTFAKKLNSVNSIENDANLAKVSKYLEFTPNVRRESIMPLCKDNNNTTYSFKILQPAKENSNKNIPKKINVLQHIIIRPDIEVPVNIQNKGGRSEPQIITHTPLEIYTKNVGCIKISKQFLWFLRSYAAQMNIPLHDDYKLKSQTELDRSLNNDYAQLSKAMATLHKSGKNKSAETQLEKFPKERALRRKWLRACNVTEKMIASSSTCVCSKHFKSTDFDRVYWPKARLRPNVVPCVRDTENTIYPIVRSTQVMSFTSPSPSLKLPAPLKKEIKIIEVFSEEASNSKSRIFKAAQPPKRAVRPEINDDDNDIEITDEYFVGPDSSHNDIKISQVFSEAPQIYNSGYDSDSDIEIIEDSFEKTTNLNPEISLFLKGPKVYNHNGSAVENEEFVKFSDILKQTEYIHSLTVDHFSTPKVAKQNLEITKMTVANLEDKMKRFRVDNHKLLNKIEHYKNVLLYLRNNNVILKKNDLMMVDKLL